MPGVRSKGQTLIGCWCDEGFVEKIDRARQTRTRSQFCREAIADRLRTMGYEVSEKETASPDRAGKRFAKQIVYPITPHAAQLNEPSSPSGVAGAKGGSKRKPASGSGSGSK
jgi:hypothetical protein